MGLCRAARQRLPQCRTDDPASRLGGGDRGLQTAYIAAVGRLPLRFATDDPSSDPLCTASVLAAPWLFRLPDVEGDEPKRQRQRLELHPIGYFHVGMAVLQAAEGKLYLFIGAA